MVSKIPLSWLFVELDFLLRHDIDAPYADHANLVFVYLIISVGWVEGGERGGLHPPDEKNEEPSRLLVSKTLPGT